jgi:hypothetical protein
MIERHAIHSNRWFTYFGFTYRYFFTGKRRAGEACGGVRITT